VPHQAGEFWDLSLGLGRVDMIIPHLLEVVFPPWELEVLVGQVQGREEVVYVIVQDLAAG